MVDKDSEHIEDKIKELMAIQERTIVEIFNNIEKIAKDQTRVRGGINYIQGTNFRLELRKLRHDIIQEFRKVKK